MPPIGLSPGNIGVIPMKGDLSVIIESAEKEKIK
jgi:hypothetical protein